METVMAMEQGEKTLRLTQKDKRYQIYNSEDIEQNNLYYINFDIAVNEFNKKMEELK